MALLGAKRRPSVVPSIGLGLLIAVLFASLPLGHARADEPMLWRRTDAGKAYEAAVKQLEAGRYAEAAKAFEKIAKAHPGTLAGEFSAEMLRVARKLAAAPAKAAPAKAKTQKKKSVAKKRRPGTKRSRGDWVGGGRTELLVVQAASGAYAGTAIALGADVDARPFVALGLGGAAVGLVGALLWGRYAEVSPGRTLAMNMATLWGAYNGLGLVALGSEHWPTRIAASASTGVLGVLAAGFATTNRHPDYEDAALVSTGALWGGAFAALIAAAAGSDDDGAFLGASAIGGDLGAAGAGAWAWYGGVSNAELVWANLGGVAGGAFSAGLAALAGADFEDDPGLAYGLTLGGAAAGLVLGYLLTPASDGGGGDAPPLGALVEGGGDGGLRPGLPLPSVAPAPQGKLRFELPLVRLSF